MRKIFNKGFTLLELLIVIAIIGILAGVVLVSFPSASKKAKLGNALRFSDNVRGSLQPDMVAWWKFDEVPGATIAKDSWWNGLNGTVSGATFVEGIKNNALSFNGSGYVSTPTVLGNVVTIGVWATFTGASKMLWCIDNNNQGPDLLFGPPGSGVIALNTWDGWLNSFCNVPADANQWHYYVTIITPGNTKLYIDAKLCGIATYKNPAGTSFYISSGAGYDWVGKIDDVQIYSAALPVAVIQQLYANGLATHQNLAIK